MTTCVQVDKICSWIVRLLITFTTSCAVLDEVRSWAQVGWMSLGYRSSVRAAEEPKYLCSKPGDTDFCSPHSGALSLFTCRPCAVRTSLSPSSRNMDAFLAKRGSPMRVGCGGKDSKSCTAKPASVLLFNPQPKRFVFPTHNPPKGNDRNNKGPPLGGGGASGYWQYRTSKRKIRAVAVRLRLEPFVACLLPFGCVGKWPTARRQMSFSDVSSFKQRPLPRADAVQHDTASLGRFYDFIYHRACGFNSKRGVHVDPPRTSALKRF